MKIKDDDQFVVGYDTCGMGITFDARHGELQPVVGRNELESAIEQTLHFFQDEQELPDMVDNICVFKLVKTPKLKFEKVRTEYNRVTIKD